MRRNDIGAEGAEHIAEALKSNATLQQLEYVATHALFLERLAVLCSLLYQSVSSR